MPIRILSVDDEQDLEALLTQYFRRKIRRGEYEFTFAHDGVEALDLILRGPHYDIILSDINMPEMDGLTLLARINEMRDPAMRCIIVSAYGDLENIRVAMNEGAFDFATKPIDMEDLERTIEKAVKQIAFVKEAQREHDQLEAIRHDLSVAQEIQQSILPKTFPPFPEYVSLFDLYARMTAAKSVGGDFYDFFMIDDCHLGLTVADVSDKGVPAAIFMAISRTVIRTIALSKLSPAACMAKANEMLCKESVNGMFVTAFYAILNIRTGLLTYCDAGHNQPVACLQGHPAELLPLSGGMALGVMPNDSYCERVIQLAPGDRVFLYTDGESEATDPERQLFGERRLLEVCEQARALDPRAMVERVAAAVHAFVGEADRSDDITMMALAYNGGSR